MKQVTSGILFLFVAFPSLIMSQEKSKIDLKKALI
jgi:hypothetical protein